MYVMGCKMPIKIKQMVVIIPVPMYAIGWKMQVFELIRSVGNHQIFAFLRFLSRILGPCEVFFSRKKTGVPIENL